MREDLDSTPITPPFLFCVFFIIFQGFRVLINGPTEIVTERCRQSTIEGTAFSLSHLPLQAMASPSLASSAPETLASTAAADQQPGSDSNASTRSIPEPESKPESEQGEEQEEEAECGFCLFMKGGGCKDAFIDWEKCVEAAEKSGENVVEKCFEVTSLLRKCMDAHADYYEPILRVEEAMADSIAEEREEAGKEEGKEEKAKVESSG